jgi:histidinol-phosphate/aromatic aminotransferase/cobyric acid decarboxylase-like protein
VGYIVANKKNIELLKVIHNGKDVTNLSMYAINAAIDDITYYYTCLDDFKLAKEYLQNSLDKIIKPGSFINGYSIRDGMFFLIFSKDPQRLTETFAKHGIIVRNKHDEVPNAIRISMPSLEIMKMSREQYLKLVLAVINNGFVCREVTFDKKRYTPDMFEDLRIIINIELNILDLVVNI